MMNDLKEILEALSEKGYTPAEFMIMYELSSYDVFLELDEARKKEVCEAIYSEYLKNDNTTIEELTKETIMVLSL